jgi:predicted phage tail protein
MGPEEREFPAQVPTGGDLMANVTESRTDSASDASVAELVKQLSEQSSRLARQEVELAKAELAMKGKRAGIGAGMFGGAGIFGFYAVGALVATAILALSTAVVAWLAALIVTVVLAAIAGVLALQGKTKVQQATPPVPEEATESVKEDVQWAKTRAQQARQ